MSSAFAITAILALIITSLAPLALVVWKPAAATLVATIYSTLLAVVGAHQTGLLERSPLPNLDLPRVAGPAATNAQCLEVLTLLDRAGVIIDRRRPPHIVVEQDGWPRLPEEGQQVVLDCVRRSWPQGSAPPQVELRAR